MTQISSASSSRKKPKGSAATKKVALPQVMSQIARKFDPVTIRKIRNSAVLSLGGILVGFITLYSEALKEAYKDNPYVLMAIPVFATWAINTIKEFFKGKPA